ncbi:energy transducer TonB [Sphingomonas sp. CGMCC 1.13654]|uniref:Energy transducer TonB n=1 Tax=Sphingomonas chungangi TaxID=2683589 RepID=A0A838LFQ9_9SPHN|nr:energy transducer TonB [Sphingomonas chungangi]MBA2936268.1 energy transducer TonB [Sphingomonas chungangi]MVW55653.1 TonB family protein [Sphingomonas chungangi]
MLLLFGLAVATTAIEQPPRPVRPDMWVSPDDYPPEALRNMWDGLVGFTLYLSSQGQVTGCAVTQSSGHSVLDDATCTLMAAHARFVPGKDAGGQSVAGEYQGHVNWQIPDRGPVPLAPSSGTVEFDVDASGRVHDCKSTLPDESWPNLGDLCTHFQQLPNVPPVVFAPGLGKNGQPVPRHVVIRVDMTVSPSAD